MAYINGRKVLFAPKVNMVKNGLDTADATDLSMLARGDRFTDRLDQIDTSSCTIFDYMCEECAQLINAPDWDTSKGDSFQGMFGGCVALTEAPPYNLANGTTFSYMFDSCGITKVPDYNFEKGTSFGNMFAHCTELKTVGVLNTPNGKLFANMFTGCSSLETIAGIDISTASLVSAMFTNCSNLKNLTFFGTIKSNLKINESPLLTVESLLNVFNALIDVTAETKVYTIYIGADNKAKLTEQQLDIAISKGWVIS